MPLAFSRVNYDKLTGNPGFIGIRDLTTSGYAKHYVLDVTGSGATPYRTGGFEVHAKRLGLKTVTSVNICNDNTGGSMYYDHTTDKILIYTGLDTELADNTDIRALKCTIEVWGI